MPEPKPVTVGRLPRVFVAILALDTGTLNVIIEELSPFAMEFIHASPGLTLAQQFHAILQLPKNERRRFADQLDSVLDKLLEEDAFGTEGQNDPRGDHRE